MQLASEYVSAVQSVGTVEHASAVKHPQAVTNARHFRSHQLCHIRPARIGYSPIMDAIVLRPIMYTIHYVLLRLEITEICFNDAIAGQHDFTVYNAPN